MMDLKDMRIGGKFLVGPKIGGGSFGDIYLVTMQGTDNIYALKKEDEKTKHPQLMA